MTIGGSLGHVEVGVRVFMSGDQGGQTSMFTHAVPEQAVRAVCGAPTPGRSARLWPQPGETWPAGPNRCPACATAMSAPRA